MTDSSPTIRESVTPPTFEGLTDKQARFVVAYVESGGKRGGATEAALAAGYGGGTSREQAKSRASELLRNEAVLKAIRGEVTRTLSGASAIAVRTLVDLCESGPPQVRLSASKEILDRAIGPIMSRNAHIVASARSIEDIIADLDREEASGEVIDAEYAEAYDEDA